MTTPDDKMPHTNVVEGGLERPNHSPSSSRPHISTSTPGPGPTRARTVGPVVNTSGHAPPARLRARPRSSRPCASNAARSRGQEGMRRSRGGARANICGALEDPGLFPRVLVGAPVPAMSRQINDLRRRAHGHSDAQAARQRRSISMRYVRTRPRSVQGSAGGFRGREAVCAG